MNVHFPLHFDPTGRTAVSDDARHIRNLIEQVLFTSPGERVNRPEFGSGVKQLVFAPNSDELAATVQALVEGELRRWLADRIQVGSVHVENAEEKLQVVVEYTVLKTGQRSRLTSNVDPTFLGGGPL